MAKNDGAIEQNRPIGLLLDLGGAKSAGDVVAVGDLVVYAQTDTDTGNDATCFFSCSHVQRVAVVGENKSGNTAVAAGDLLYFNTNKINKNTDGKPFGYALDAVDSGATTTIRVGFGL
jgi:predicted RecA/RadA family phage recombinase